MLINSNKLFYFRASGSLVVMDPYQICRKSRRLRGKLADICRNEPALLKQITNGVLLGQKECQYQFRHRRWNCTSSRRSMRKVLLRGKENKFKEIFLELQRNIIYAIMSKYYVLSRSGSDLCLSVLDINIVSAVIINYKYGFMPLSINKLLFVDLFVNIIISLVHSEIAYKKKVFGYKSFRLIE